MCQPAVLPPICNVQMNAQIAEVHLEKLSRGGKSCPLKSLRGGGGGASLGSHTSWSVFKSSKERRDLARGENATLCPPSKWSPETVFLMPSTCHLYLQDWVSRSLLEQEACSQIAECLMTLIVMSTCHLAWQHLLPCFACKSELVHCKWRVREPLMRTHWLTVLIS